MSNLNLFWNINAANPTQALVRSQTNPVPVAMPDLVLGDTRTINLYLVDGAGNYSAISGDATYSVKLGIGTPGAVPSGGTFNVRHGSQTSGTLTTGKRYILLDYIAGDDFTNVGAASNADSVIFTASGTTPTTWTNLSVVWEISAEVAYDATAATLQTALNNMASITADGGVTVSGGSQRFLVAWNSFGNRSAMVGDPLNLTPDSGCVVSTTQAGTAVLVEKQSVRLQRQPAAIQDTWGTITSGWSADLSCNTVGLLDLLAGAASVTTKIEVEIADPSGNRRSYGQVAIRILNEVIDESALVPTPLPDYLTSVETHAQFVQNRSAVTALTGGGTALDGIITAAGAVSTGSRADVTIGTVAYLYQLQAGTDAESSPAIIRPDDYNGATNARVWKLLTVLVDGVFTREAFTITAAGNTNVTMPAGSSHHSVTVTITDTYDSTPFTRTITLPLADRYAGDVCELRLNFPTSIDPTVEMRNATSGGTLLTTFAGQSNTVAIPAYGIYKYSGTAWEEYEANYVD